MHGLNYFAVLELFVYFEYLYLNYAMVMHTAGRGDIILVTHTALDKEEVGLFTICPPLFVTCC